MKCVKINSVLLFCHFFVLFLSESRYTSLTNIYAKPRYIGQIYVGIMNNHVWPIINFNQPISFSVIYKKYSKKKFSIFFLILFNMPNHNGPLPNIKHIYSIFKLLSNVIPIQWNDVKITRTTQMLTVYYLQNRCAQSFGHHRNSFTRGRAHDIYFRHSALTLG